MRVNITDEVIYGIYYPEGTLQDDIEAFLTEEGITPVKVEITDYDHELDDRIHIAWKENGQWCGTTIRNYYRYNQEQLFDMWQADREQQLPEIYGEPD